MRRAADDQGTLFGRVTPSRPARRRQPPKQTTVTIGAAAIAGATVGRIDAEPIIAEAVRASRPDVQCRRGPGNDPNTIGRLTFGTPTVVRDCCSAARGDVPEPFRFILGGATRVTRDG
jgi:hypothetical protein